MLRRTLALVLLATLAAHAAAQRSADASIGVWPFLVGDVDSFQNEIIAKAKSTGLDTIYMHVWRTTGSQRGELRIRDEPGTWDSRNGRVLPRITLSQFIDKAHAAGIQVVGVVQIFRSPGPLPNDLAHQKFMVEKVLRYLVHSYRPRGDRVWKLDGIAFDFIRWFGGNHDASLVNRFIDAARKEVGAMPLHAFVIAGAFALDGSTYDNRFRTYAGMVSYLTRNFGQNWEDLARRLEVLMPMAYTASGHVYGTNTRLMEGYLNAVGRYGRQAIRNVRSECRLVPAIRTWNSTGQTTTPATIEACARGALRGSADGFMAFRYFTARPHAKWFQSLAKFAQPGPDLPIAALSGSASGVQVTTDTTGSRHASFGTRLLTTRFDIDGDGEFETGPKSVGSNKWILPGTGNRVVGMEVRDPAGNYARTAISVGVPPILTPTAATLSASRGGTVAMRLFPGQSVIGSYYFVLGTLSGATPGTPLGKGVTLPINFDAFTGLGLGRVNQVPFRSFFGTISFFGFSNPTLRMPAGLLPASLVGATMHFAALDLAPATLTPRYASNPVEVRITR